MLEQTEGLALLKGKWVEVDHEKLRELLAKMEEMPGTLTLFDAMQMELGQSGKQLDVGTTVSNEKETRRRAGRKRKRRAMHWNL